jgi:replicative DNA helicase
MTTTELSRSVIETLQRKIPPHSPEVEKTVLSGILHNYQTLDDILELINENDFYLKENKIIFKQLCQMNQQGIPINLSTLCESLDKSNQLKQAGDALYLADLTDYAIGPLNTIQAAIRVKKLSIQRSAIFTLSQLVSDCYQFDIDLDFALENAQQKLYELSNYNHADNNAIHIKDATGHVIKNLILSNENALGIPSGFSDLDKITNGFKPSDLIIVAGRPSMGKTAFALSCAIKIAAQGIPVAFSSLEMSKEQIAMRAISTIARVDLHKMQQGYLSENEKRKCVEADKKFHDLPVWIDDTPAQSIIHLRNKIRLLQKKNDIQIVFIDYLQLIRTNNRHESREREVAEISSRLKALAKELNIPVVALAQLNRELEKRSDKRPILSDLRESGSIEQDADLILFLYREEVYKRDKTREEDRGIAEIIVGKHRNGKLGTAKLKYFAAFTSFANLSNIER